MSSKLFFLVALSLIFPQNCLGGKVPGWLWYNEKPIPKKPPVKKNENTPKNSEEVPEKTAAQMAEEKRKEVEEATALAVLKPTDENVRNLQRIHVEILNTATRFQKVWSALSTQEKPFGVTIQNPKTQEIMDQIKHKKNAQKIKSLNKRFGLFFIFSKDCPYCHEFAPVVRGFSKDYGFEVLGISPDGKGIPDFPNPKKDNGILRSLNPDGNFPGLFWVDIKSKRFIPIAQSLLNRTQLEENAISAIEKLESERVNTHDL